MLTLWRYFFGKQVGTSAKKLQENTHHDQSLGLGAVHQGDLGKS